MWMRIRLGGVIAFAGMLTVGAPSITGAQSASMADTYTWSGEFVAVDQTGKSITVKPRVAYQEALTELSQFRPGEQVWVVWSGVHDYSDAIRQVRRSLAGARIDENLVLPAELVSPEAHNQYVTIRVKVPESSLAALQDVRPGEWVTVIARHRPARETDAVVTAQPYGSITRTVARPGTH